MDTPFFSIVIPLFNKEKYVENTLRSIINQNITDYEVIIVNDFCTDASVEKIKPFLNDKIKLIDHEKNKGLSAARNTGIKNAEGSYVVFLDADDTWLPTYLGAIENLIKKFKEARIFATNVQYLYPKKIIPIDNSINDLPRDYIGYIDFFKDNQKQGLYCINSVCYHKSIFETIGFFQENITFSEEIEFYIRSHLKFKFAYDVKVHANYHMDIENQLSQSNIANKNFPDYDIFNEYCNAVPYLKQFLDIQRYILAKHLKFDGDKIKYKKIISSIDLKNLNYKQVLLLKFPIQFLLVVKFCKKFSVRIGIKYSSYNN